MVFVVAARRALQRVARDDLETLPVEVGDDADELPAGRVVVNRCAEPGQLLALEMPDAASGSETVGAELHVRPAVEDGADVGLVRRLVRAEPHVTVWPEDL